MAPRVDPGPWDSDWYKYGSCGDPLCNTCKVQPTTLAEVEEELSEVGDYRSQRRVDQGRDRPREPIHNSWYDKMLRWFGLRRI